MIKKSIRWLYYLLFFVTPLVMNSNTSEIFEFNKIIVVYFITVMVGGLWLINHNIESKPLNKHPLVFLYWFFLLSQLLSTIFSIDPHTSIWGYYGRFNGGLLSVLSYFILFYVFADIFDLSYFMKILKISLVSSFFVVLWGLPGKFGADLSFLLFTHQLNNSCWTDQFKPAERMFSTLGQPNWLGAYLAICFFIGLYFVVSHIFGKEKENRWKKALPAVYLLFNFVGIIFTGSRSALLAVIISVIVFSIFFIARFYRHNKKLIRTFGFIMIVFLVLGVAFTLSRIRSSTHNLTGPINDSFAIRRIVWRGAWALGLRYPLFGTGVETFAYAYYFVRPIEHNLTSEWDFLYNKAHNEYLNYLATTGFVGLTAYLLLIGSSLWLFFRDRKNLLAISLGCAYLTIIVTNAVGFSTSTINLYFYLLPSLFLIFTKNKHELKQTAHKLTKNKIVNGGIIIVMVFLIVQVGKYYLADIQYAKANSYLSQSRYSQAFESLISTVKLKHEHVYEDKLSYTLANLAYLANISKEQNLTKKLIGLSDAYNKKSLKASPQNVLYWKTRAKNYYLFYQITQNKKEMDEAIQSLKLAKEISPTDPKIDQSLALFYLVLSESTKDSKLKENDRKQAKSYINEALKLKPDFVDALELQKELSK